MFWVVTWLCFCFDFQCNLSSFCKMKCKFGVISSCRLAACRLASCPSLRQLASGCTWYENFISIEATFRDFRANFDCFYHISECNYPKTFFVKCFLQPIRWLILGHEDLQIVLSSKIVDDTLDLFCFAGNIDLTTKLRRFWRSKLLWYRKKVRNVNRNR